MASHTTLRGWPGRGRPGSTKRLEKTNLPIHDKCLVIEPYFRFSSAVPAATCRTTPLSRPNVAACNQPLNDVTNHAASSKNTLAIRYGSELRSWLTAYCLLLSPSGLCVQESYESNAKSALSRRSNERWFGSCGAEHRYGKPAWGN